MDSEKLLIIGCGDLGQRIGALAAARGVAVTGLKRSPTNAGNFRYVAGDYTDLAQLRSVLGEGFDRIVLTPTPTEPGELGYRRGYVELCQNLTAVFRGLPPPQQLLLVSSTSVYGQIDGCWVNEASVTEPENYRGQRVLEAETLLREAGMPVTVARLAGIYGPGRDRLINRVRAGILAPNSAFTNRIQVDDAARAVDHLLYAVVQPQSLYLVSDGEAPCQREVVAWLAERMQVTVPPAQEVNNLNKRVDNRRLLATGFELRYCSFKEGFAALIPLLP